VTELTEGTGVENVVKRKWGFGHPDSALVIERGRIEIDRET